MNQHEQVDFEVFLSTVLNRLRQSNQLPIRVEVQFDQQYGDEEPYDVLTVEFRQKKEELDT